MKAYSEYWAATMVRGFLAIVIKGNLDLWDVAC
jgi:hypothetical protein